MINILFVDDEPNILEGLQRMLRSMRNEWNISFAGSGAAALSMLRVQPVDVIVSDMKMPGMDGAELFQRVSESHPQIVRVILSGYSEKETNMKSVGTAHQYLSKPCDLELLKSTIERVCTLRELLTDDTLRRLVSQLPTIPSLPPLYSELVRELEKKESSTRRVGDIVQKDIGMTVKILQIVNSAFFGLRRHISDSRSAVEFLGLDTISSLTLGLGVIAQFSQHGSSRFFAELWAHSMSVGVMANKIAAVENSTAGNDAFTAGLLHDIGRVVFAVNLPDQFNAVEQMVNDHGASVIEAEKEVFGATHAEVGAYLLGLWGLPTAVVQAVAYHHSPRAAGDESFSALTAVHVGNAIQHYISPENEEKIGPLVDNEYLEAIGLAMHMPMWIESCEAMSVETARIQE